MPPRIPVPEVKNSNPPLTRRCVRMRLRVWGDSSAPQTFWLNLGRWIGKGECKGLGREREWMGKERREEEGEGEAEWKLGDFASFAFLGETPLAVRSHCGPSTVSEWSWLVAQVAVLNVEMFKFPHCDFSITKSHLYALTCCAVCYVYDRKVPSFFNF